MSGTKEKWFRAKRRFLGCAPLSSRVYGGPSRPEHGPGSRAHAERPRPTCPLSLLGSWEAVFYIRQEDAACEVGQTNSRDIVWGHKGRGKKVARAHGEPLESVLRGSRSHRQPEGWAVAGPAVAWIPGGPYAVFKSSPRHYSDSLGGRELRRPERLPSGPLPSVRAGVPATGSYTTVHPASRALLVLQNWPLCLVPSPGPAPTLLPPVSMNLTLQEPQGREPCEICPVVTGASH